MIRTVAAISIGCWLVTAQAVHAQDVTLIAGARVFDGSGAPAKVEDVLVKGEQIIAVGKDLDVPEGASRVDGSGKTLIPGLHDLHTHMRSPGYAAPEDLGKAYAGYLLAGVTTVNDFSVSGEMIAPIRELVSQPGSLWAPHLQQAVRFGVPGGHGTEYGWGSFFTMQVATPRAAHAQMALALSYDPDVIKVFADGWRYGRDADLFAMNEQTLKAIVDDARRAGKPVITHTVTLDGAKTAARAGVNAVGHGIGDALIDKELVDLMRRKGTAYIATLVVYEPQQGRDFARGEWTKFNPQQRAREEALRNQAQQPLDDYDARRWKIMRKNITRLKKAGIAIGIGTDAGIGGIYHGPATIREIMWLTKLGFSPAEALVAATRTSADIMGQADVHGTIRPGMRADLVLIDGRPDKRIEDLWQVSRLWISGRAVPLEKVRQLADAPTPTPLPVVKMTGPILTPGRAEGRTDLNTLPVASTDPGTDHSTMIAADGANVGTTFLAAQMGEAPRPYVQWILPLTRGPIAVADASDFAGIELSAKGRGDYRLILESYAMTSGAWFAAPFDAAANGNSIRIPFAAFASRNPDLKLDLGQLRALRIELSGPARGTASLELGPVRFYRP